MEAQKIQLLNDGLTEQWWQVRGPGCLCPATAAPSSLEAALGVWSREEQVAQVLSSQSLEALRKRRVWAGEGEQWTISQFLLWTKSAAASTECQGLSAQAAETLPPWVDMMVFPGTLAVTSPGGQRRELCCLTPHCALQPGEAQGVVNSPQSCDAGGKE
jgi:hypothetical protein